MLGACSEKSPKACSRQSQDHKLENQCLFRSLADRPILLHSLLSEFFNFKTFIGAKMKLNILYIHTYYAYIYIFAIDISFPHLFNFFCQEHSLSVAFLLG